MCLLFLVCEGTEGPPLALGDMSFSSLGVILGMPFSSPGVTLGISSIVSVMKSVTAKLLKKTSNKQVKIYLDDNKCEVVKMDHCILHSCVLRCSLTV